MRLSRGAAREVALVLGLAALAALPFLGKAYHVDEALYLPVARQILREPLRPYAFDFNWYGSSRPYAEINNTPPLLHYLLAAAWALTGGVEWAMRLAFLPLDLLCAAALYGLAARFLSRPLLPVLILLACPAYWINMGHLMAEKPAGAFGFAGLYALVKGVDEKRARWYWASAGLLGLACLAKYNAASLLLPALAYARAAGLAWPRLLGYAGLSLSPLAAYFLWDSMGPGAAPGAAWLVTAQAAALPTSALSHRLRAALAFTGGCGIVTAAWPFLALRPPKKILLPLAAALGLLFSPAFDLGPLVRFVDRLTGFILALGAFWGLWIVAAQPGFPGGRLWRPWILGGALILAVYWSVMARLVFLILPPLVFALAALMETRWPPARLRVLQLASLAVTAGFGLALSAVDYRYAQAQKELAREVSLRFPGRAIWCAGHWGLQHYLEEAGSKVLDQARGGWEEVRPGDVVVVPRVNSNVLRPSKPLAARVERRSLGHPLPLRLMSGFSGEGGFYTSVMGFLPFSLGREPLDEIEIVEAIP